MPPSKIQIDPKKPLAGCRIEVNAEGEKPITLQCKHDRERLPAAKEQNLQCHLESKFEKKDGKLVLDFLLFCGPKTGALFRRTRRFRALDDPQLKRFLKEQYPKFKEKLDKFKTPNNMFKK